MENFTREQLVNFCVAYRLKGSYENRDPIDLPDGRKQMGPFIEDGFTGVDTYEGTEKFEGTFTISRGESLILEARYQREIVGETELTTDQIYTELKKALREFPRDKPWVRGPKSMELGHGLIYTNTPRGGLSDFKNLEKIFLRQTGDEIYQYIDWREQEAWKIPTNI
ncbi:hypothetical protein CL622_08165 [archaeon]|nr:hypothetical protein [archaeon]|tara:strand:+ start:3608 stop:4108 length:501 start_codon:yes stop_codon:yes gene_type:complete